MKYSLSLGIGIAVVICLASCSQKEVETQTLKANTAGPDLVSWDSKEGQQRLSRSKYLVDFFKLANNFENQRVNVGCGPASAAIVLNSLRLRKPDKKIAPAHIVDKKFWKYMKRDPRIGRYTPNSLFTQGASRIKSKLQVYGQPMNGKPDYGLQLSQLSKMLQSHGLVVTTRVVGDKIQETKIREDIRKNLETADDYVIVNYARKSLGQSGGGHISPVGAYDAISDSFLILDTNSDRTSWAWVKTSALVKAMRTFDTVENRGYLLIKDKS